MEHDIGLRLRVRCVSLVICAHGARVRVDVWAVALLRSGDVRSEHLGVSAWL